MTDVSDMPSIRYIKFGKLEVKDREDLDTDHDDSYAAEIDTIHDMETKTADERI